MPPGSVPKEMDAAIKRLEAGEDPEKIEADMGDILGDAMGGDEEGGGGVWRRRIIRATAGCIITKP